VEMASVLGALEVEVPRHFANEEAFMARIAYPERLAHCREHRVFLIRLQCLIAAHGQDETGATLQAAHLLFAWFRNHVLEHDMALVRHAKVSS